MSTSLLCQEFGISSYHHASTVYHEGAVHFRLRQGRLALRCQVMGRFRTVPIGRKPV